MIKAQSSQGLVAKWGKRTSSTMRVGTPSTTSSSPSYPSYSSHPPITFGHRRKRCKTKIFLPFLSEHLSEHVIFKVDPEKKKKYLAYAKETVYWEACLEKGERLEQKVTCSVHLPFALSFISNFLVHRIHGKSSEHAWPSVSYSLDGSSLP